MEDTANEQKSGASVWQDMRALAGEFSSRRSVAALVIGLGVAAALGEVLSVGLAVMLLFSLLRQEDRIENAGGILADVYLRLETVFGAQPVLIAGLFLVLLLVNSLLGYASNAVAGTMLNRIAERMRDLIHARYVGAGYVYLQKRDHGSLIHTLAEEPWTVAEAFVGVVRIAINLCAVLVFGLGLFVLSWQIGLTAMGGAVAAFGVVRLISRPVRRLGQRMLDANQVLSERMLIALNGMRTLRVFALEPQILAAFGTASARVRRRATRMELVKAAIAPLNQLFGLGILLLIVLVAGQARIDAGTTIAAVLMLFRLQPYLHEIEQRRVQLAGMAASLKAVRDAIDPETGRRPPDGSRAFGGLARTIRFEGVGFTHDPRFGASLSDLSFTIAAGRITALSGPSGSGKTTILNLILRLYEPGSGRILVDGADLAEYSRASWLHRVTIAGQDVDLLDGTVMQNIRLANPAATDADVREACAMAEILDDLLVLPDGLDTRIGAHGLSFSGGQRQRIGLARAFLRDPEVLLLDEAMSALEPDREARIWERIARRMAGRTVIFVSHRRNATDVADDVVEIRRGHVIRDTAPDRDAGPQADLGPPRMTAP